MPRSLARGAAAVALATLALGALLYPGALLHGEVFFERDLHHDWYPRMAAVGRAIGAGVWPLWEPGLGFVPEPMRIYPNRELAAHVLGFEGLDGGLEGVERAWNGTLAGTPGSAVVGRDALGRDVLTEQVLRAPQPGHGVMLTLDRTIQHIAERELDNAR